jgi:hypothetical protein
LCFAVERGVACIASLRKVLRSRSLSQLRELALTCFMRALYLWCAALLQDDDDDVDDTSGLTSAQGTTRVLV